MPNLSSFRKGSKAQFFVLSAFIMITIMFIMSQFIQPSEIFDTSPAVFMDEIFTFNNIKEKAAKTVMLSRDCGELGLNMKEYEKFVEGFVRERNANLNFEFSISQPCDDGIRTTNFQMILVSTRASIESSFYTNSSGAFPYTAPSAPTGLTATSGDAKISLSWAAPADSGRAISDYKVEHRKTGSDDAWTEKLVGSAATKIDITSLTNGQSYDFKVSAINSVGEGTESAVKSATPADTTKPAFSSATLYELTGVMTITFSEAIDQMPKNSVDLSKLFIQDQGTGNRISLDGAAHAPAADDITVSLTLSPAQLVTVKGYGTPTLDIGVGAVKDPAGNSIDASVGNAIAVSNEDKTKPTLSLMELPNLVSTIAGDGTSGFANGIGTAARFNRLYGIAIDSNGNLYVADSGNHIIRKIAPDGTVTTFAGTKRLRGSDDGIGTNATFFLPERIAADSSRNLYVADSGNHIIRKIAPNGNVSTFAGTKRLRGSDDGIGTAARFNNPKGIAVDGSGNIYVVDTNNHIIRKISPKGEVTTIAGKRGSAGFANGIGTAARFLIPIGIAIDGSGNLYVADYYNHIIRKISPNGNVSTFAGTGRKSGSANGIGTAARFNKPEGIAVDGSGNIYVADTGNHIIRKIAPNGMVSTLAGTKRLRGSDDGIGTAAKFNSPRGIAVDGSGNIYVADTDNHIIRKMSQHPEKLELDRATGQLTIKFSKNIDISKVDPAKLHIRGKYSISGGITLSSGELTTVSDSDTLQFTLNPANKVAIAALTTPQLDIDNSAVTDTVGNKINAAFDYPITMFR